MAISRPLLLALLAALLTLASVYAALGARESGQSQENVSAPASPPPAAQPAAPKPKVPAKPLQPPKGAKAKAPGLPKQLKKAGGVPAVKPDPAKAKLPKSVPAPPKAAKPASKPGLPAAVQRAFARKDVVVLFFRQRRGADDSATATSVAAVRGVKGVSVITDRQERLPRYRRVIENLGIDQAPAVVLVDHRRQARLVEGFVDAASLRQQVLDLR